jgi:plastocyanin
MRALASLFLALGVLGASAGAGAGHAAGDHVVPVAAFTFLPPRVAIPAGDGLTLTNLDVDIHTLTSVANGADGRPLFGTPFPGVVPQQSAPVAGVGALAPGSYDFFCSFHQNLPTMHGTLVVQ